jgi:hypothetical protein
LTDLPHRLIDNISSLTELLVVASPKPDEPERITSHGTPENLHRHVIPAT